MLAQLKIPTETVNGDVLKGEWLDTPIGLGLLGNSGLYDRLKHSNAELHVRSLDVSQVMTSEINQIHKRIRLPVTFTPYASVKPCSARCWFCSENLQTEKVATPAAKMRPTSRYHEMLAAALDALKNIPMGLSLSGLEISDDLPWLAETLAVITNWQKKGGVWTEKAAYTNAAGFADKKQQKWLIDLFTTIKLDRMEVSRHHFDPVINQNIMRFRHNENIQHRGVFEETMFAVVQQLPVTLVCILQQGGVASNDDVFQYIDWAHRMGVKKIIFRELSVVPESYVDNNTKRWINLRRSGIETLVSNWLATGQQLKRVVAGYYFWNAMFERDGLEITFERSDYNVMKTLHAGEEIHKLVFFPNGNLCADWDPNARILAQFGGNHVEQ